MGIGIPSERQQDIFQRFYQISPMHTRLHEGSGIGLSLVKSLTDMHHGIITVESECGSGSTFIVELPCNVPSETTDKEEPKSRQALIENIRLEFSDIELGNNTYLKAE
jgi:signal transduction histidine kinase